MNATKTKQNIPKGWQRERFNSRVSLQYGSSLPEVKREDGTVPVYGSNGRVGVHSKPLIKGPGIIVGRKGTIGAVTWSETDFWPIDTTYFVEHDESIDLRWLYHELQSLGLQRMNTASGTPGLNREEVYKLNISIPPLSEQKKIAEILESVDDEIQKTDEIITATEKLKTGLMQQLFTRGIGHTKFKKTEVGEIPVKWSLLKLRDVVKFTNGKAHEKDIKEDGKYIVINSKFISTNGRVFKRTDKPLSPLSIGDIAMVMSDIPKGKALAKCFFVEENEKYTLNQRICSLRSTRINNWFLFFALNRNKYFLDFDNGVGQTNLRKDEVLNCPIQLPPKHEQQKIVEMLSAVDGKVSVNKKVKGELDLLKKGLMQDLLSGKVRVPTT